ncbi:SAM-dependent methyltransferase [Nocardiopsis mwathae]|uniref:SAM-dependent methyltransferase n=1 Tax=Nocardiopsis mwathae TaxID=1472723 RepID=A0A7W9YEZ5_9ACTN|nr:class I SAM-dependent methyltransferase [Nocardiopsis mwathae]MBB6170236.1 SAM-dependent methyltransferase [Nocardiopsis mwathae]
MAHSTPSTGDQPTAIVYTDRWMRRYDLIVCTLSTRLAWGCSEPRLVEHYRRNLRERHLDVGVGTGKLLDTAGAPAGRADFDELHMLDINAVPLQMTAHRLRRFSPVTHQADALATWPLEDDSLTSVCASLMLHTLPDQGRGFAAKTAFFDQAARVLAPGGRFFGSTIVNDVPFARRWPVARLLISTYNKRDFFTNANDSSTDLRAELEARFDNVRVRVRGCTALWEADAR